MSANCHSFPSLHMGKWKCKEEKRIYFTEGKDDANDDGTASPLE